MIVFTIQFWFALLISVLFVVLVLAEIYMVAIKRHKRYFWNGLFTLIVLVSLGYAFTLFWTAAIKESIGLDYGESLVGRGGMSKNMAVEGLRDEPSMCVANKSEQSKVCMNKLRLMQYEGTALIDYYVTDSEITFFFGTWPNHTVITLPFSEFDKDFSVLFNEPKQ
jgi:hypothetical protein